jgi:hypothetical protein
MAFLDEKVNFFFCKKMAGLANFCKKKKICQKQTGAVTPP